MSPRIARLVRKSRRQFSRLMRRRKSSSNGTIVDNSEADAFDELLNAIIVLSEGGEYNCMSVSPTDGNLGGENYIEVAVI